MQRWLTDELLPIAYYFTGFVLLPGLLVKWYKKRNRDKPG